MTGIESKYRVFQCMRLGHVWIGMGYGWHVTHERCRRCGERRTVTR